MVLTVIESPFGTRPDWTRASPEEVQRNLRYLKALALDSLERGEAPFASHGLYPLWLNDAQPEQRALGMAAGFAWGKHAARVVVGINLGITPGMRDGEKLADLRGQPIEYRKLPPEKWSE